MPQGSHLWQEWLAGCSTDAWYNEGGGLSSADLQADRRVRSPARAWAALQVGGSMAALVLLLHAGSAAAEPRAEVRGELSAELRAQLVRAIGEAEASPSSRFEARRRARSAVTAATALLRSEGYYQPTVEDIVEGEEAATAIVEIMPGPRFLLVEPTVQWSEPQPPAEVTAAVMQDIGLKRGDPGRAVDVIAAEGLIIAGLSRRGYADAAAEPRRVVVDHASYTLAPDYRIASGRLVRLDGVRLETPGPTSPDWVAGLAPWAEGAVFDPEKVAELERRLTETGIYDTVGVALAAADQTLQDGNRPVIVTLADRSRRLIEIGAGFSTAEGIGIDAIWTWRNRLGRADTLAFEARLADIDSRLGADLSLPHWRKPGQTLKLSTAIVNEDTDAYVRTAFTAAADLQQRIGRTSFFSYGLGFDAGRYSETRFDPVTQVPLTFDRDLAIVTGRAGGFLDRSDDPLDPRRGYRLTLNLQPTAVTGEDTVLFLRTEAQATLYLPLQEGGRTLFAVRVRAGSIAGGGELSIPSDRLFYSGGGGSVRGYEFQAVSPRLPDGTPRGGLSLFETSLEIRRDIGNSLGAVAFIDAGSVGFQETPGFNNMRYSAGIGARYRLPFGPLRADIAMPLNKRDGDAAFQVYISIGQAF